MNEITDQLWVSDIQAAREYPTDDFDRVVTVCQDDISDNVGCAYDQFRLADGPHSAGRYGGECSYELFTEATDAVVAAMRGGEVVLVHCHAGVSRSAAVATAAVAVTEGMDYHGAFGLVGHRRPPTNPGPVLKEYVQAYIEENGG